MDTQGNFRRQPVGAGFTYFFSRRARQDIRAELEAQVEKMLAAGVRPWFLNGHLNIHLHPAVWPLVRQLAEHYNIPAVRLARENLGVSSVFKSAASGLQNGPRPHLCLAIPTGGKKFGKIKNQ